MFFNLKFLNACLVLSYVVCGVSATISPGDKVKHVKKSELKSGPQADSVFDRGLVSEEPLARDILIHNAAYYEKTSIRNFNGTVLGYITPWNSHGYDVVKTFAGKFNIISPVWLNLNRIGKEYILNGAHDIDTDWMNAVRRRGKSKSNTIKIFPRVLFDKFTERDYSSLLSIQEDRNQVSKKLVDMCREYGFDGIVIEFWSQLASRVDDHFLFQLVIDISTALRKNNLRLILVIPPLRSEMPDLFGQKHMEQLYKHVYAFSLMTYDYSNIQRPGANAPIYWMRRSIENIAPESGNDFRSKRHKILMGLNMYGYDYTPDGGGPIVANQYLDLVKYVKKRLPYDERDVENYFEVRTNTGRHIVFYPSLYSINERIKLAQEMEVGISLWELGQGLDYFYDLF